MDGHRAGFAPDPGEAVGLAGDELGQGVVTRAGEPGAFDQEISDLVAFDQLGDCLGSRGVGDGKCFSAGEPEDVARVAGQDGAGFVGVVGNPQTGGFEAGLGASLGAGAVGGD